MVQGVLMDRKAPASVIASWPPPNYVNPESRGPGLEIICILFSVLATALVTARLYARVVITRAPGWDDLLIVLGLGFSDAVSVMVVIGNRHYFSGRHVWDVPPSKYAPHRLNIWICEWLFTFAGASIKISVLLFYRRLSCKFPKGFLIATWIGIYYNLLWLFSFMLTGLFICWPTEAYWKSFDPSWAATNKFHCANEASAIPAIAGLSVLGDLYSTLLPLLLIFHLPLPFKKQLALCALFAVGFLATGFGIARLYLSVKILNYSYDFTWNLWELWIWAILELYVGIIAASAPALKALFLRAVEKSTTHISGSSRRRRDPEGSSADDASTAMLTSPTPTSASLKPPPEMNQVRVHQTGNDTERRERRFGRDMGHGHTRSLTMRMSHCGKLVPMRVLRKKQKPVDQSINLESGKDLSENFPEPAACHQKKHRPVVASQSSQQTIYVGFQVEPGPSQPGAAMPTVPTVPNVDAKRVHDEEQRPLHPMPEDWYQLPRPGKITAMHHATELAHSRSPTIHSHSASVGMATLRSMKFDPDRIEQAHGRGDEYMI